MNRRNDYKCVICGAAQAPHGCDHWYLSPGYCSGAVDHNLCPGQATGRPEGSCCCSCHVVLDEDVEAATYGLLKIQLELEKQHDATL